MSVLAKTRAEQSRASLQEQADGEDVEDEENEEDPDLIKNKPGVWQDRCYTNILSNPVTPSLAEIRNPLNKGKRVTSSKSRYGRVREPRESTRLKMEKVFARNNHTCMIGIDLYPELTIAIKHAPSCPKYS